MRSVRLSAMLKSAVAITALTLSLTQPQKASAENLADALVGAYNTSGLLQQNRALLRAADEDVAAAVATLRPILDWTASITRTINETSTSGFISNRYNSNFFAGITATWLLYDGGGRSLDIAAAKETVLATRQQLLAVEQSILLRAVAAYVVVNLTNENVRLRENNLRVLGEELRASQDRFDVGEVTRTDVALAESRVAQARSELAFARGEVVNAKAEYIAAVGSAPGVLAPIPALPQPPGTIAAAQDIAVRNHPSILSAQRQVSAAELTVNRVGTTLGPTVSARADFGVTNNYGNTNYSDDASVSLIMRQPIYQGGGLNSNIRQAMASRDATRANLLNVQRDVVQEANNAYVRLEVARASLIATGEQIRAAQVAFDGIREEATLGARTTLDVLTAEQNLLDAYTAQISAQAERSIAAYQLLAAQGLLTAERLRLGVQIYDPTIYYNLAKGAPAAYSKQSQDLNRVLEALGKK